MNILVVGSGAREHTIIWKLKQSKRVETIYAAPGNAGIKDIAELVDIKAEDLEGLLNFAKDKAIDLTVVGPEVPLVMGIVDLFEANGLKIFGPDKACAHFEGSKAYSKDFMDKYKIPTAAYKEFTSISEAKANVNMFGYPLVIKADGLAAGKGVVIAEDQNHALSVLEDMMGQKVFGDAGNVVVFEEFLTGIEASVLCFVDGKTIVPMTSAQDYKKAFDGDLGLNTGGMGSYSPSRLFTEELKQHIHQDILEPFLQGTITEGLTYKGVVFIGIMIEEGKAKVIEFNCRLGDPETQSVLPRMENDLLDVIEACIDQKLDTVTLSWSKESTVCVVLASGGYPGSYEKGKVITGLEDTNTTIFHAGTRLEGDDIVTNGGRVLSVLSFGDSIEAARRKTYENVEKINFDQKMYRTDIAK